MARQKLIRTEKKDYFIDLVFYNYILKSFVLIDLKTTTIQKSSGRKNFSGYSTERNKYTTTNPHAVSILSIFDQS